MSSPQVSQLTSKQIRVLIATIDTLRFITLKSPTIRVLRYICDAIVHFVQGKVRTNVFLTRLTKILSGILMIG